MAQLTSCIDWISFTFPPAYTVEEAIKYLGFDMTEIEFMSGGASGYSKRCKHVQYNIWFLYAGNENMGVHVDCSGSAVQFLIDTVLGDAIMTPFGAGRIMEDLFKNDLQNFFMKLCSVVRFSRIDLAIDDTTGLYYSLQELHEVGKDRNYIPKFKQWREVFTKSTLDGTCIGYTVYMGSRESDTFIRVYDKKLEQEQKQKNLQVPYKNWVRWEMELKHDNADLIARKLSEYVELKELVFDLLNHYIRIIDLSSNSRKCRCRNTEKWDAFVGAVHRIKLKRNDEDIDIIERKRQWLKKSVSKSLSLCIASAGGDDSLIYDMLEYGKKKFRNSDYDLIRASCEM